MNKKQHVLELQTILEHVSKYTRTNSSKNIILNLEPDFLLSKVKQKIDLVHEIQGLIERFGKFPFYDDFDILSTAKNLDQRTYLNIDEFILIRQYIEMEKSFKIYLSQMNSSTSQVYEILKMLAPEIDLLNAINEVISEDGLVFDHVTSELHEIRKSLKQKNRLLEKLLSEVLVKYQSYLNESLIVMRNGRYAIPIKESFKNKVKGVIHDVSASKQTVYIEPDDIRQVTQDIEYLNQLEQNEILKILQKLTKELKPYGNKLYDKIQIFIKLDSDHAKALYGKEIKASKVTINDLGVIDLKLARHPLLDPLTVVPIDMVLNQNQKVLMITGPNTGGKTVALKTLGLLTLMTQVGLLIPALPSSTISIFKHVFADIGDEQSIQQSLSTFSSHLIKIKEMIDSIKGSALILLDEVGSGTDPLEGVSLAIAIIDYLRKKDNVRLVVTTHYSELKLYAFEQQDILTASVAFDEKTLKPLYKLQLGIAGSSHALSIAKRLGMKDEIINHAQTLLSGRQSNLAKSLEKLSHEQAYVLKVKEELRLKEIEANRLIQSLQDKNRSLERDKEAIILKVKEKELKKYEKLKEEALQMIEDLSKMKSITTPEVAMIKGKLNQKPKEDTKKSNEIIELNDHVYIKSYQQEGVVIDIKKDKYVVSLGLFDLPFERNDLEKIEQKIQKDVKKKVKVTGTTPTKQGSIELDLRGVRFEDVKNLMDKAVDDALLSNLPYLRVIHGFGTGAVRKAVHDYIKQSPYIKSHRYGAEGEGLNGVTIISF